MAVVAQKLKEAEIIQQDSLNTSTRNLLRIAIFNISYIRGLYPENYSINDKSVPAFERKIKMLMPVDAESCRLVDWMEKGVYVALQKKYLKTLLFCICEAIGGPMIEEYAFSFSYSNVDGQDVSININCSRNKKQGGTVKSTLSPIQMKSSDCKMIRTLIQTLDKMPEERTILMKLLYYDNATPADYESPFIRGCTAEETRHIWTRNRLRREVGNVNSKHVVLALKVKRVLDPCEENGENQDERVSLGADSILRDDNLGSHSKVSSSQEDHYIVAPAENQKPCQDKSMVSEGSDNTRDPAENEYQLSWVKDWIRSCCPKTVETTHILANFHDISVVLIEEMNRLTLEGFLSKTGKDTYAFNKEKDFEYEFSLKELIDPVSLYGNQALPRSGDDYLYREALYHALPMDYITVAKLKQELDRNGSQTTARKLLDNMTREGFVEATSNRELEKKLSEVRKALDVEAMDVHIIAPQNKLNYVGFGKNGNSKDDMATCGVLYLNGLDLTSTRVLIESASKMRGEVPHTPASKAGENGETPVEVVEEGTEEKGTVAREEGVAAEEDGAAPEEFGVALEEDEVDEQFTPDLYIDIRSFSDDEEEGVVKGTIFATETDNWEEIFDSIFAAWMDYEATPEQLVDTGCSLEVWPGREVSIWVGDQMIDTELQDFLSVKWSITMVRLDLKGEPDEEEEEEAAAEVDAAEVDAADVDAAAVANAAAAA